ncbi:c-type cytochrome biogenesis protein CcsB [Frondihabitans sp. PhB161]|uniref:c-type cytochrome biogenesis protein CcsB n=1 Tax=unclassified Frondihabitans TaxID=2626248 RepID=UPI000F9ADE10|nr:cytochrome c-type biogenesis protein CcsB [Frondihabitans sp. PhB153]RPF09149.1 cytochrome c-type biogenesis protein CcsB [Frondihabitans sp. PhB161]
MTSAEFSTLCLYAAYSAIAIYVIAFIAFALDLAKRSGDAQIAATAALKAQSRQSALAGASASAGSTGSAGGTLLLERTDVTEPGETARRSSKFERIGISMMVLGLAVHIASVVFRGLAAGRVPWANMFEFGLTGTALIVGVFLLVNLFVDLRYLGAYVMGLNLILLGVAVVNFYVTVSPLVPALQSYWLVIHVFVACLGTAFFAIAGGLSAAQIIQERREASKNAGIKLFDTLPGAERLEDLAYRIALVGFVLWTFTLIAGAVWAEKAWGRYWGWDTKEVWTFIIWVIYAGYIHARATRGWRGARSSWLSLVGFAAVMFNFSIVNLFFKGLHAYSGL